MYPYKLFPDVCDSRWHGEKCAKSFCHCENATFWKVCFYRPLRFQRNGLVICTIFCQNIFWTVINCSLVFVILDNTRKWSNNFFQWKGCLLSEPCVFNNLLGSKKSSYKFQSSCQNTFWTLINFVHGGFSHSIIRGKMDRKILSLWKQLIFWNVCFYPPVRSKRSVLIYCTITVREHFGRLENVSWHLSYSIRREK